MNENDNEPQRPDYKILVLGDSGVGKTSLIKLYESGQTPTNIPPSIGLEFYLKNEVINDKQFLLKIWNTAGQEKYKSLAKSFYKNARGFLLVYSVADIKSFLDVEMWIREIANNSSKPCWILVGNKSDLKDREVPTSQGFELAKKYGVPFCETSIYEDKRPQNSHKINDIFKQLVQMIDKDEWKTIAREEKPQRLNQITKQPAKQCKC